MRTASNAANNVAISRFLQADAIATRRRGGQATHPRCLHSGKQDEAAKSTDASKTTNTAVFWPAFITAATFMLVISLEPPFATPFSTIRLSSRAWFPRPSASNLTSV